MPDGIEGALTRKLGPLPVWAYLGVGGAAVILFVLYRRGQSASSAQTSGALAVPSGVSPTIQGGFPQSPPNPPTGQATGKTGHTGPAPAGFPSSGPGAIPIYSSPTSTSVIGWAPFDSDIPVTGPSVSGRTIGQFGQSSWYPVNWGGTTGYLSGDAFTNFSGQGGMGSGSAVALFGDGRHANPATQLSPTVVTQHVSTAGMGGGSGGRQRHGVTGKTGGQHAGPLRTVHERTGVSMLRLLSLNPGFWRPGSGQPPGRARVA